MVGIITLVANEMTPGVAIMYLIQGKLLWNRTNQLISSRLTRNCRCMKCWEAKQLTSAGRGCSFFCG
jgi:hypothetical protein